MTTPLDLISAARRAVGSLASGETLDPNIANDDFNTLNDMLDQWSNSPLMIFCKHEVIHELTAGTYIYTIGNGGDVGATFTGSIAGTTLTITALLTGAISVGQTLTDGGVSVLPGTAITSYGTGRGGTGSSAIGTYILNLSQTVSSKTITSYAVRPLRINKAIVRVVNSLTGTLDFEVSVINLHQYESIGIKTLPGPWPKALYYQPSETLGVLNYWPNPSQGEMHLFCDAVLNRFNTLSDVVSLPQGFNLALRYNLAELLLMDAGKINQEQIALVKEEAAKSRAWIKRTNMQPPIVSQIDPMLTSKMVKDAGWILAGGFDR